MSKPAGDDLHGAEAEARVRGHLSRHFYLVPKKAALAVLGLVGLVAVICLLPVTGRVSPKRAESTYHGAGLPGFVPGKPGGWGELECASGFLEIPDELVQHDFSGLKMPPWYFGDLAWDQIEALFRAAELPDAQRTVLLQTGRSDLGAAGFVLAPSRELVLSLSPGARKRIYTALAADPRNTHQAGACRVRADRLDEWLEDSDLDDETIGLIRRLLYPEGTAMLFADTPAVLLSLSDDEQRIRLLKTVSRSAAVFLKVRVSAEADTAALARYWGQGGRARELEPLFEALSRVDGDNSQAVSKLLPPFARNRLYVYPFDGGAADRQTCYWTALNFFNAEPDERFSDLASVRQTLESDYTQVFGDWRLGDLILLMDGGKSAIHACNFVAEDIVFTKNGPGISSPWVLMKLSDVLAVYPGAAKVNLRVYRLKKFMS